MTKSASDLKRTLITGVIGSDTHIVGNRILSMALEDAGYHVVTLGALTPAGRDRNGSRRNNGFLALWPGGTRLQGISRHVHRGWPAGYPALCRR